MKAERTPFLIEYAGPGDCTMGQGDAVDDRQLDMLGPIVGKRNTLKWAQIAHTMLSESSWQDMGEAWHKLS